MQNNPSDDYMSLPLEENIFEWQFAIRGPRDTEFEGGIYHGRIQLPPEYPFKPPAFVLLTPNGRFETQTKICLSISQYHPEHWQPSWSVRTALVALIAFMPTKGNGAIGSLEFGKEERKALALKSVESPPKYGNSERQKLINEIHEEMVRRFHPMQDSQTPSTTLSLGVTTQEDSSAQNINKPVEDTDSENAENLSQAPSASSGVAFTESSPTLGRASVEGPLAEARTSTAAPITRAPTRQHASDDRGLTLLAIGLVVALAALLIRKLLNSRWWMSF